MDKIKCDIMSEIYNNGDFHIYGGILRDTMENISIKTDGFSLTDGEHILVGTMGKYNNQPSFQCKYEEVDTSSKQAQKNILMSIKGIKEATANMILDNVSDINIYRQDNPPKIKGIGPGKIILIKEGLQLLDNMQTFKDINIMLGHECSPSKIKKITQILETLENGMDKFKLNPYSILIDKANFGFKQADKIALSVGIKQDSEIRKTYLTEYLVNFYTSMGNCFIPMDELEEKLRQNNVSFITSDDVINNKRLEIEDNNVYTKEMYQAECSIPGFLSDIIDKKADIRKLDYYELENLIQDFEKIEKIKLDITQLEAVKLAVNSNASIITGGAGSGKTTILRCVLYCLTELHFKPFLAAPTGKASRRMEQATGMEAVTIHRFLNLIHEHYAKSNCVMVIDEFSMVDTELFYFLLSAMEEAALDFVKLIIVGDPGQLPSVQAGNCLNDLIESKKIPVVKLVKTFRQKEGSNIIDVATKIRNNQEFDYMTKSDFFVKEVANPLQVVQMTKYFFSYLYSKYDDIDKFYSEVQFISPIKKGHDGVLNINDIIKKEINPGIDDKYMKFSVNDKIMCTKNDRHNEIMNGEFGRVTQICNMTFTVYFQDLQRYVTYLKDSEAARHFQLSYCATVHKLQGSEFKYIVLILSQDSMFIDSRLFYTGITRGKQTVILLTNKAITSKVIARNNLLQRNTKLKERLCN